MTASLRSAPEGARIARILAASIRAVEPGAAVERCLRRSGDTLEVAGRRYDLAAYRHVKLLGIGKAAVGMSTALANILGLRLDSGLVVTKHSPSINYSLPLNHSPFTVLHGDHPVPDIHSLDAGQKALDFVSALGPQDLLFCLISGGGSALVATPLEGIALQDLQALTSLLLTCGARIDEFNSLRRRLERLKGGGLVRISNGATIISLILSDVVGNPLEAIASGPTAPDPTRRSDILSLVKKYKLKENIPPAILSALQHAPETPKPGDPIFEKVHNVIVGSGLLAAQAALSQADLEGFHPYLLRVDLQGEARQAAFELTTFLRQAKLTGNPAPPPACILVGGETTVTVTGNGTGGRNTELALAAVTELAGFPGVMLISLATDGEDGPTAAAGAVVTGDSFRRAVAVHLQPDDFLSRNDSYPFFASLDDLLKPGPTGTNVNDLVFLFIL